MTVSVDLAIESPLWSAVPDLQALTEQAILAALLEAEADLSGPAEVSCLFCDDAAIRGLNAQWRGIDTPTNVLSFPAGGDASAGPRLLGDIVIAYETVLREADRDGMPVETHVRHLVIHGLLHLLGYDHEEPGEAEAMEAMESRTMTRLGQPDPWRYAAASAGDRLQDPS